MPLRLRFTTVFVEVNVIVYVRHPAQRDEVVLAVGAVVLRELDRVALHVIDLPEHVAARAVDFHVLANVGGGPDRSLAVGQLGDLVFDSLGCFLDPVADLVAFSFTKSAASSTFSPTLVVVSAIL